jgi:hypothetical protein
VVLQAQTFPLAVHSNTVQQLSHCLMLCGRRTMLVVGT